MLATDPHSAFTNHAQAVHQNTLVGLGSAWWLLDAIYRGLPPWSVVPPALLASAALLNAVNNFRQGEHSRRGDKPPRAGASPAEARPWGKALRDDSPAS